MAKDFRFAHNATVYGYDNQDIIAAVAPCASKELSINPLGSTNT